MGTSELESCWDCHAHQVCAVKKCSGSGRPRSWQLAYKQEPVAPGHQAATMQCDSLFVFMRRRLRALTACEGECFNGASTTPLSAAGQAWGSTGARHQAAARPGRLRQCAQQRCGRPPGTGGPAAPASRAAARPGPPLGRPSAAASAAACAWQPAPSDFSFRAMSIDTR